VNPGIVRPLLGVDRTEVECFLRERAIAWREDSTNASLSFARNRLRHDLLPHLARDWNPSIASTLASTAEWAAGEESWWEAEMQRLSAGNLQLENGAALVRTVFLAGLAPAVARRFIRHAIRSVRGSLRGIGFDHVESALELARKAAGSGRCRLPGLDTCRSFDWVRFANSGGADGNFAVDSVPATVPGLLRLPGSAAAISLELIEKSKASGTSEMSGCVYNGEMGCLDWRRLSGSLVLRNWKPGDRYQPTGRTAVEKIRTLFQEARIPSWERRDWPVLTDGNSIIWSRQFGPAADLAAGSSTQVVLRVREIGRE
jgi:tRNA(Ile)-lysidine synthase